MNSKDALKALKEFFIYVQANYTEPNTQLLYYTLWQINNKTGWLDEFQSANTTLCAIMGISERTLIKNRLALQQLGFIKITRPKSRRARTIYSILYPTVYSTNTSCTELCTEVCTVNRTVQSSALYIHNTNTNTLSLSPNLSLKDSYLQNPEKDEDKIINVREIDERDEIAQRFSEKIKPLTKADREQLDKLKENYSKAQILAAIERAAGTGYSVGYIRAILLNSTVNKNASMELVRRMGREPSYDIEEYEKHSIFDDGEEDC